MIRIGLIGTGNFAKQHAEVLNQLGAKIVACFGSNAEKTAAFSTEFQCKIYDEPLQLISRDIIDALYIAIPPFAHDGHVELKAIDNQIPFLCEKPLGLDLSICKKISEKINQNRLITSSGYLLRYHPLFIKIKEIIDRNKITTTRICSYAYMPEVHWWRKEKLSGGMMVESGTHYVDLLRYLFGEISSVASVTSTGLASSAIPNCDTYDSMEAILKFQSGNIASIGVTHLLNTIQARNDELHVYGQDFALKVDLYKLRYKNEGAVFYKEPHDTDWNCITDKTSKQGLLANQSDAFIKAIQENNPSLIKSTYPDAVKSLAATIAMNESAEFGRFLMV
ncbi:MAG TPA: Gfo/Idh/MocA family oxidoreductase [Gammaproteobacteria bacterium]|nr:Gfo/Idh/MocA family oxidoreductase [Gammaproteobacteria bacterium]